jgi:integrase
MPTGGPCHPQYLSRLLSRITEELGLPRLSAHGLRHTSATLMLANGVAPMVAAERLGHSDPSLFLNLERRDSVRRSAFEIYEVPLPCSLRLGFDSPPPYGLDG